MIQTENTNIQTPGGNIPKILTAPKTNMTGWKIHHE